MAETLVVRKDQWMVDLRVGRKAEMMVVPKVVMRVQMKVGMMVDY